MTDKQADAFVLEKWDILRKSEYVDGEPVEKLPEKFLKFWSKCAWCDKYYIIFWNCNSNCPLIIIDDWCYNKKSTCNKWNNNKCQRTANDMYKQCEKAIKARNKKNKEIQ